MALFRKHPFTIEFPFDSLLYQPSSTWIQDFSTFREMRGTSQSYTVQDNEGSYKVSFDIPGVKSGDLSLTMEDNTLHLSGERKVLKDGSQVSESEFEYQLSLGDDVDMDHEVGVTANLLDGVLSVDVPKKKMSENREPRTIEIVEGQTEDAVVVEGSTPTKEAVTQA